MPSFDIVSEIEMTEVHNATDNTNREIATRYDFRGVEASAEFKDDKVELKAESDFQCQQLLDMFRNQLVKRKVDPYSMDSGKPVHSGRSFSITVGFKQGVEQPVAKKIVKLIKDNKLKVQASIQGDQVRVTGKKRDELQSVMGLVKEADLGQSFQFNNFRD